MSNFNRNYSKATKQTYKHRSYRSKAEAAEATKEQQGLAGKIGMLRQWLNERSYKKLITNEDLEEWLLK